MLEIATGIMAVRCDDDEVELAMKSAAGEDELRLLLRSDVVD
jgi:hypothetical protein